MIRRLSMTSTEAFDVLAAEAFSWARCLLVRWDSNGCFSAIPAAMLLLMVALLSPPNRGVIDPLPQLTGLRVLHELDLDDAEDPRETALYRLSFSPGLERFR